MVKTDPGNSPVTVDGAANGGAYTFPMPASDVTVSATYLSVLTAITEFYFPITVNATEYKYGIGTGVLSNSGSINGDYTIAVTVPSTETLGNLPVPQIKLADTGASVARLTLPDTPDVFSGPITYRVTAEDGTTTQDYVVTVTKEADPIITEFYFTIGGKYYGHKTTGAESGSGSIDGQAITVTVPYGTGLASLAAPEITRTPGGALAARPDPQADFSSPVIYTVETALHSVSEYTVTVEAAKIAALGTISGMASAGYKRTGSDIKDTVKPDLTVTGTDSLGTLITIAAADYTLDSISPQANETGTSITWPVLCVPAAKTSGGADLPQAFTIYIKDDARAITGFAITQPVTAEGSIDGGAKTVAVTVPYGTSVTSMTTDITVSAKATVSPASGTAWNFASPVTYTVTAEDGTQQAYTVTVTVQGQGTVSFTFTGPADEAFGLGSVQELSWKDNTSLIITSAPTDYETYQWYLDGDAISEANSHTLSRTARDFSLGRHVISVWVTKPDGKFYSKELEFTVVAGL
jgi:hypothetical protein